MKRKIILLLSVMLITILCGCMADPPKGDKLKADLEESFYFQQYGLKIDSVTVDKRQTNKEIEKTDTVYCTVVASTKTYQVTESIIGQYIYYDEGGWILENVYPLSEPKFELIEEFDEAFAHNYFTKLFDNPEFLGDLQFDRIEMGEDELSVISYSKCSTDFGYATITSDCTVKMKWSMETREWEEPSRLYYTNNSISIEEEYFKHYTFTKEMERNYSYTTFDEKYVIDFDFKVDSNIVTLDNLIIHHTWSREEKYVFGSGKKIEGGSFEETIKIDDCYQNLSITYHPTFDEIDGNFNIIRMGAVIEDTDIGRIVVVCKKNQLSVDFVKIDEFILVDMSK